MKRVFVKIFLIILVIFILIGCTSEPLEKVTISLTGNPDTGLILIASEKGLFSSQGLDVTLVKHDSGKSSLSAVLNEEVDIGVSAETPIVFSAMQNKSFYVLSGIFASENSEGIIARIDSGINNFQDLHGKKIATIQGSSAEFVLHSLLELHGMSFNDVSISYHSPGELNYLLTSGKIDAVSIWQPHIYDLEEVLGDNAIIFFGDGSVYTYNFYLVSGKKIVHDHPEIIEKVLLSLSLAEKYLADEPQQALKIISSKTNKSINYLEEVLRPQISLKLQFTQAFILALEDQSRWAIENNFTSSTKIPNYLNFIYSDILLKVNPEAVTIIQ